VQLMLALHVMCQDMLRMLGWKLNDSSIRMDFRDFKLELEIPPKLYFVIFVINDYN